MMNIDVLLDTREKRKCGMHLLVLLFMCWMVCIYIQSAITLISLETYDQLYNALTSSSLDGCYLARFILRSMSMSEFQIGIVIANLWMSLHMIDIVFMLVTIVVCFDQGFLTIRKHLLKIPFFYIVQFSLTIVIALMAMNEDSLQGVIHCVRGIGWGIMVIQLLILGLLFLLLLNTIKSYREALQYMAIEILEE